MRIMVQKVRNGVREYVVVPGRREHKPPVVLRGTSKKALAEALGKLLDDLGGEIATSPSAGSSKEEHNGTGTVTSDHTRRG